MRTCTSAAPGLTQHRDDGTLRIAPDDRVVDDDAPAARLTTSRSGFSLSRMPSWRIVWLGWMNVRPT